MTRALVITNPAAARTQHADLQAVLREFASAGWRAEVLATGGPGDARRLAAYGVDEGVDVVAVFGGDGTAMQAAAALVGSPVPLGIIPGGTGNLLAGNLRIPASPVRAVRAIVRGTARPFDLGRVEREGETQYFAVACGAGIDAMVMASTTSSEKRRWGMAAYAASTIRLIGEIRSAEHRLVVDGREYEANAALVLVANCGEVIPPFIRLKSDIRPDDGLLDVIVIRADSVVESVQAVWDLLLEGGQPDGLVGYARGSEILIESDPLRPVEIDGEVHGTTPIAVSVVPNAIRVMAPTDN